MAEQRDLPEGIGAVVEHLAALVHDAWVEHRRTTGWRYGRDRDDGERRSPALVPYDELEDAERELDRITVRRTLRGLRDLGYRVELAEPTLDDIPRDLLLAQTDALIARGQPLLAYDLTKRWLARHATDAAVGLRNARALRRCGALQNALDALARIEGTPDEDGERRGLLAAVHKEMFVRSPGSAAGLEHLRVAQELYQAAFEEAGGKNAWHGVNAATLALLQGREAAARALANRATAACPAGDASLDYWRLATLGEAALVRKELAPAAAHYRAAVAQAADRAGDVASTRQNARLLLDAHGADDADRAAIQSALRPPAVVIFATQRSALLDDAAELGDEVAGRLRAELAERVAALNASFGFSGAAPGPEMLFAEALLARNTVATVVLPWPRSQFASSHLLSAAEPWRRRFAALLGDEANAPLVQHVVSASLGVGVDSPLYERFAQQLMFGLARLQATTLGTEVVPIVVRNGSRQHRTKDELDELIACWGTLGVQLAPENVIDVASLLDSRASRTRAAAPREAAAAPASRTFRVMAILFADVEDYSQIPEQHLPSFIEHFVGGIANRLCVHPFRAENVRRVGDGLLMVFATVRDAGLCALDLVEWLVAQSQPAADGETYWSRLGLPREIRARFALHAGPVFECIDPLTRAATFEGAHINYAARIEPVTPSNQVYASEAFAALAMSWPQSGEEFVCEYVGRTSLAKDIGEYPLYHIRRRV